MVTGEYASDAGPDAGPHDGAASHWHVTATPPAYQSLTRRFGLSVLRCSAAAHTATNSSRGTRRLPTGMRAMSCSVTSTHPG